MKFGPATPPEPTAEPQCQKHDDGVQFEVLPSPCSTIASSCMSSSLVCSQEGGLEDLLLHTSVDSSRITDSGGEFRFCSPTWLDSNS
ncbi:MAG: hypothetical protein QOI59_1176 [Gammaproteobacteria bacterium]|nr:hypothetical protein [Gammaproteobacteria bacterium]